MVVPYRSNNTTASAVQDRKGSPIARWSLPNEVATRLREQIISGEIREGEQLRQDQIASSFEVSRIPVREALRQLEAEGLVTIVAHHGAVVSALSPEEIRELFDLRSVLEVGMLRRAIPHLTQSELEQAEQICEAFEASMANETDVGKWGMLNWQFHSTLYGAANRPLFLSTIRSFHNNADRYIRLHLLLSHQYERNQQDHRKILELCRQQDINTACDVLDRHITTVGCELSEILRDQRERKQAENP
jgi:DNA-binding GntR family transcriptional regulator